MAQSQPTDSDTAAGIAGDGGVVPPIPRGSGEGAAHDPRVRRLFRVAVAIAVAPILISAVRSGLAGWFPAWRSGYVAVMTNDVFTSHVPLIGPFAATSSTAPEPYSFPGAIQMYLLAVPVELFGISWGILLGTAAINTAAFVAMLWLVRRRVGYRLGLIGCILGASLIWALGGQVLTDATPLVTGLLPFPLVLVAAWSVSEGDAKGLVPLAAAGNYLLLAHLKFTIIIPMVSIVALGLWAYRLHRRRKTDPGAWPQIRTTQRRWFVASVLLSMAMWAAPIAQQLSSESGNLSRLLSSAGTGGTQRNILDALGVVFSTAITWPLWFRNSFNDPNFTPAGPSTPFVLAAVGAIVLITITSVVLVRARRQHDTTVITSVVIAAIAYLGWTLSALHNPASTVYYPPYFHELWSLAAFTWLVLAIGLVRTWPTRAGDPTPSPIRPSTAGMLVVTLFAVATIPAQANIHGLPDSGIQLSDNIYRTVVDRMPDRGPVYMRQVDLIAFTLVPAAILALQRRGIEFRVSGHHDKAMYGTDRAFRAHPPNAAVALEIRREPYPPLKDDLFAVVTTEPPAILRRPELTERIDAWSRSLTRVHLPPAKGTDALQVTRSLNGKIESARQQGSAPTDDIGFLYMLSQLDRSQLETIVDIPGEDVSTVEAWIEAKVFSITRVWLYLTEL